MEFLSGNDLSSLVSSSTVVHFFVHFPLSWCWSSASPLNIIQSPIKPVLHSVELDKKAILMSGVTAYVTSTCFPEFTPSESETAMSSHRIIWSGVSSSSVFRLSKIFKNEKWIFYFAHQLIRKLVNYTLGWWSEICWISCDGILTRWQSLRNMLLNKLHLLLLHYVQLLDLYSAAHILVKRSS